MLRQCPPFKLSSKEFFCPSLQLPKFRVFSEAQEIVEIHSWLIHLLEWYFLVYTPETFCFLILSCKSRNNIFRLMLVKTYALSNSVQLLPRTNEIAFFWLSFYHKRSLKQWNGLCRKRWNNSDLTIDNWLKGHLQYNSSRLENIFARRNHGAPGKVVTFFLMSTFWSRPFLKLFGIQSRGWC